jgi:hypothetical protein
MVKGERRKKREEIRRIVAEDEKRRKDKAQKKASPRKTNYRRDKEGNVILFGNLRMSKLSILVLVAIGGIGGFFYLMSTGIGEMEGYIEPEFSFESCQENGFTADMCKFYYKFCREYADGTSICEFAEEDPWVNYDRDENRWTEEEQDFLPPTQYDENLTNDEWNDVVSNFGQFILPMAYGEGRAESEPVCYSSACKIQHPNLVRGEGGGADTNISVKDARASVSQLEIEIQDLEKKIREYEIDMNDWDNDVERADDAFDEGEDEYDMAKADYRHAFDVKVRNQEDIDNQKTATTEFKKAQLDWKKIQQDWKITHLERDENYEKYYTAKQDLSDKRDELEDAMETFDDVKLINRVAQRGNNQFVNIILSDTCLTMIENNFTTNCPTYRELRDAWDNTIPSVSGQWVENGSDISREPSGYKKYWNYYRSLPNWKIITVDPDNEIKNLGVNIIIHPRSFTYLERVDSVLKNESLNLVDDERYIWKDIQFDKYCSTISIAPTSEMITKAVNYAWEGCNVTIPPEVISVERTYFKTFESIWYKYSSWLSGAMEKCKDKC